MLGEHYGGALRWSTKPALSSDHTKRFLRVVMPQQISQEEEGKAGCFTRDAKGFSQEIMEEQVGNQSWSPIQFLGNGDPHKNLCGAGSMGTRGNRIPLEIQRDL